MDSHHGHTINVNGHPIDFDTLFDECGDYIAAVAVFTHDLADTDVLTHARAYLEREHAAEYGNPYNGYGIDEGSWPEPSAVRRVWARWRDTGPADHDAADDYEGYTGAPVWEESTEPGDGLRPACVVDLAS